MDGFCSAFGWGSPIGIGVFIVSLALTIYLLSKTSEMETKKK